MSKTRRPTRTRQPNQTRRANPIDLAAGMAIPKYLSDPPQPTQVGKKRYTVSNAPDANGGLSPDLTQQMQQNQAPQGEVVTTFAPGAPLIPAPDVGTPLGPRIRDYRIGVNFVPLPRGEEPTSYEQLRAFADLYYAIPLCKRAWFDVLNRLLPKVTFDDGVVPEGEADTDPKWAKVTQPALDWLESPDGEHSLADWLIMATNDILDLGQSIVYLNRNKVGEIQYVEVVDAATIKVLYNQRGKLPQPPWPAFEQYTHGVASWFYTTRDMLILSDTARTRSVYSRSRVEDVLLPIQTQLRKQTLDLARYTDGSTPAGFLTVSDQAQAMSGDAWEEVEFALNNHLAGNDGLRNRLKILPPGIANYISTQMEGPQTDFDRWNLNITCGGFGVTMAEIGFTEDVNRSSGDSQENVIYRRVVQPVASRFQRLLTRILKEKFDQRLRLEWAGIEEREDEEAKARTLDIGVKNGSISPSTMARLMGWPVEEEIPAFVVAQNGVGSIVPMTQVSKAEQYTEEDRQLKKDQQTAATQQQQLIDAQMQKQQQEQDEEGGFGGFGEAEGNQGEGGAEGEEPPPEPAPPAPKGGGAKGAQSSAKNATPEESSGTEDDDAAAEVDNLIENAKGKGKSAKRMQGADDDDTGMDSGRRGDPGRGDTERGTSAAGALSTYLQRTTDGQSAQRGSGPVVTQDAGSMVSGRAESSDASREWAAWYAKALKAAKAGQPQPVWRADTLPEQMVTYAQERLQGVVTPDAVRAVFAEVREMEIGEAERRGTPVFGEGHKIIGNIGADGVFHPAGSGRERHANAHEYTAQQAKAQLDHANVAYQESRRQYMAAADAVRQASKPQQGGGYLDEPRKGVSSEEYQRLVAHRDALRTVWDNAYMPLHVAQQAADAARLHAGHARLMADRPNGAEPRYHPDVAVLERATTTPEIEQWLRTSFPDTRFHLGEMHPALAKDMARELGELGQRYPEIMANLHGVALASAARSVTNDPAFARAMSEFRTDSQAQVLTHVENERFASVLIFADTYTDPQRVAALDAQAMRAWPDGRSWMVRADMRGSTRHEFGHVAQNHLRYLGTDYGIRAFDHSRNLYQRGRRSLLSVYADESQQELFAEAFSAAKYGNAAQRNDATVQEVLHLLAPFAVGGHA